MGAELVWALDARQNEVLLSWLEEGFRQRVGPRADQKGHALRDELFQNLTKHAAEVSLKVGYDRMDSATSCRERRCPCAMGRPQEALAPVIELDMVALKARRLEQLEHGARTASGGAGWAHGPSFVLPRQPCCRMHTFRIRRRKAGARRCP